MNVVLYKRYLNELQDRYRYVHEANLAQLQRLILQRNEQNAKQVEPKPSSHQVDVRV